MELLKTSINQFAANKEVILQLLSNLPEEEIHWKQAPEKWNLLEIICHLYDEEREDFRARLTSVLEDQEKAFATIDPAGWVSSRKYAAQNFEHMLREFTAEREKSIRFLHTLENASLQNVYRHPKIGPMSATFILANWLAHDYLHIRQVLKLKYDYLQAVSGESLKYAGDW